jgi:hypothetical protein
MKRRDFIIGAAGIAAAGLTPGARARTACGPFYANGVQQCESGIASSLARMKWQGNSQWCWAACIEMVFRYYGHEVDQRRLVDETWGSIVNMPAYPDQILANLNRDWTDDDGEEFAVEGDSASANPITAAQDLSQDMPLIIGTMGHAMVLTSLVYARDNYGNGTVLAATVRDPWPGRGRRILTPQEWYQTNFLARIRIA